MQFHFVRVVWIDIGPAYRRVSGSGWWRCFSDIFLEWKHPEKLGEDVLTHFDGSPYFSDGLVPLSTTRYADLIYVHYGWFKLDRCLRGLDIILFFCIDLLRDLHCVLVDNRQPP